MSQEGACLPQEVEGSHDQATDHHGSIPTGVESPAGSNPSSASKLASTIDNVGSFPCASPVVLSGGEDNNAASSKIASPAVLQAGEDRNAALSKIASPTMLLATEDNNATPKIATPAVLLAGEEKGNNVAGSKIASPATMLHDCDNNKVESHADMDNNAARSKLASPTVLHAGDGNNGGSKSAILAAPQAIVDNTTGSKLNILAVLHAGEHNNARFKVPNPVVLHVSKDMDNNAGRPKFASPVLLHAAQDNTAKTKLAIQAVSHADGNAGSSRLTRSAAAALHTTKGNAPKLAIQAVDAKEGKNNVVGEQRAHEAADMGSGSGKGKATAVEDADHDLHIFTERERRKKMKNMFSTLHGLLPQLPDKADKATIVGEAVNYIKTLECQIQKLEKLKMERKRALAAQRHSQQQLVVGVGGSSRMLSARHPAPALPASLPLASSSREVNLEDMVHSLVTAAAAAAAAAGAGGSSSCTAVQLPPGVVPFPAPAAGFQTWTGQNVVLSVANNEAYINLQCPQHHPGMLLKALFVLERNHIEVVTTTICTQDNFRMYGIHARVNPAPASARFLENLCAEDRFKLAVSEMVQLINA